MLSPSIVGVEPLDEFIRQIADFIHHTIGTRPPDAGGVIEVEAKIGVLKERGGTQRIQLPVLVETSASSCWSCAGGSVRVEPHALTVRPPSPRAEYD